MGIGVVESVEKSFANMSKENGLKTSYVRAVSAKHYKKIQDKNIDNILFLCERLLEKRTWECGVVAFDWAFRVCEQYTEKTYYVFYRWLETYVRGWGDCDDFCTHAFSELLRRYKNLFSKIVEWTHSELFWVRRASAVIIIPLIMLDDYEGINPFIISDRLMYDKDKLVQKGYGWLLKILSTKQLDDVYDYLSNHCSDMPRTSFRYALEKMPEEKRRELMNM